MVRCASCGRQHVPTRDSQYPRCGAPAAASPRGAPAPGGGDSSAALEFFLSAQVFTFMGITFVSLANYTGPFRAVSEWQIRF